MLEPDLDLEADLGIDTVKQAEIFAAVRERYGIERDPELKLKDFNTLAKTAAWVRAKRAAIAGTPAATQAPAAETMATPLTAPPEPERAAVVAEPPLALQSEAPAAATPRPIRPEDFPRRVPRPALRPPTDLLEPTGITLAAGDRVAIATDGGGVAERLVARLRARGVEVLSMRGAPSAADLERQIASWLSTGPIRGLYWLPALDPAPPIERLDLAGWREALRVRAKLFAAALRALDGSLAEPGAFVVAGTRLGGRHGAAPDGAADPFGGAVCGLAKAFGREHAGLLTKVVDFETDAGDDRVAERLVFETLNDAGVVEVGWAAGERLSLALDAEDAPAAEASRALGPESLFVVTGAAGSIVSAILRDLAATGGTYHLLDLAPEPDPSDPDIARFQSDRDGLKRELFERLGASGERVTPVRIERELAAIERRAEALAAMAAITANGGHVRYHSVDLRDGQAVATALQEIRAGGRRVDVLLHAAGLEISRRLADKPQEEFDLVFDVKADGWFNLLDALGPTPIGAAVVFSSIAGRFGNAGQTDYAAANELLAKAASHLAARHPETRAITVDWTGWRGIGMASRGSIPQLLADAGIDLLPPDLGVPVVRREVEAAGGSREIVVAGRLGAMLASAHASGGMDVARFAARLEGGGTMLGAAAGFDPHRGLVQRVLLDPSEQPFLDHHRIGGTPVLPGVMGIEAFGEIAGLLHPERPLLAIEEIRFLAPFKLFRDEPRVARVTARFEPRGERIEVHCRLEGDRLLAGQTEPQTTLHFSARVLLGAPTEEPPHPVFPADRAAAILRAARQGVAVERDEIYKIYFHGPAYQVLERVRRNGGGLVGESPAKLPAEAAGATRFLPRAIELAFQTAGIDELARTGRLGLPASVRALRFGARREGPPWIAALERREGAGTDATVLDRDGRVIVEIEDYRTIALPDAPDETALGSLADLAGSGS